LLGVPPDLLERHGAVSRECAEAMARGLLVMSPADWVVAITGIAGPGGGSREKPVGLVWLAWAHRRGDATARRCRFRGGRARVRQSATDAALKELLARLKKNA
jgi:nicotinamide-nucleotide amidase